MRKLIFLIMVLCGLMILGATVAPAFEVNSARKISWEQDLTTMEILTRWELFWADVPGGPYVKLFNIARPVGDPATSFQGQYNITVSGVIGTTVTKYFVMRSVAPDVAEGEVFSNWSEEALSDFKIVPGQPFNIIIEVYTVPK
jgi:hypothetical protein